jgi:DNA-binding NtrC family response regulator
MISVTPLILATSEDQRFPRILKIGIPVQTFDPGNLRELDPATAHWVYLLPAVWMDRPEWNRFRVRLSQATRWFILYGTSNPSSRVVQAMKDGAFDFIYLTEPVARWRAAVEKAAESQQLWLQLYGARSTANAGTLVGKSPAIQTLIQSIQRVGPTSASVLVTGESGTGKERVAQALHQASGLVGPFLPVNCAAIPRDLIESELFGAEKGAFTGANMVRQGLVEQASGGTLFLDEIGELDISLQPKLLRFLETRRARRIGAKEEYTVNARILAASNRDLESRIDSNEFRADLYYRLSEIVLKIPPLRYHTEDIPLLADYFLDEANEKFGKHFVSLEPQLVTAMMGHAWPGNARELRAAVHRMVVLHDGPVLRAEWWEKPVPPASYAVASPTSQTPSNPAGKMNRRQKFDYARELLRESGNDRTWVASQLGVHPTTLFRWIQSGKV